MVRSRVVLPAPLAPRIAVIAPGSASKDTERSARTAPKDTERSRTSSIFFPRVRGCAGRLDLVSEVGGGDFGVGADGVRSAVGDHAPEVQDDDPVAYGHHQVHVVFHEE